MRTLRSAMATGALLPALPLRLATMAAARWFERMQTVGARNAASELAAFDMEAELLEIGLSRLSRAV